MGQKNIKTGKLKELRVKAEAKLKKITVKPQIRSAGDPNQVIHELQVHQIELEMQNDELRRTQADLEASRAKYSDLYDFAPVGYFTLDKNGVVIEANLAGCQMLGVERNALIKKPFRLFVDKDSQDQFYLHRQGVLRTVVRQNGEITLVRKDKTTLDVLLESIPAADAKGELNLCRTAITNISERKLAEKAVLISEARYRRLFEATRDGILILDADSGLIVDVNPFIKDMLGYSHEEFLNKKLWEIGLFKDIVASKESFLELQSKGFVRYENLPLETKDGRHIAVEFISNVYLVDHQKVIQCNIRDITDRARAEAALRESNEELKRVNRAAVGREIRMIELKKEVKYFCDSTGQPPRYPLDFEKENDNEKNETRIT